MTLPLPTPPPLLAVALLYRSKPAFDQLRHVIDATSAFLDASVEQPFCMACRLNSVPLLERIWNSCSPESEPSPANKGLGHGEKFSRRRYFWSDIHYNRYQFRHGIRDAVDANAGMDVIRWLFDHFYGCTVSSHVVHTAASQGNLELLQFFKKHGTPAEDPEGRDIRDDPGTFPLNRGVKNFIRWGGQDMVAAAEGNHPKVVWWLHNNVLVQRWLFENVVTAAVKNEDMMMVEWVQQTYAFGPRDVPDAMKEAVNTGRIDIMNWMYEHGNSEQLVGVDNLEVFEWLHERNMVKVGRSVAWFASQGRLELAKHLYNHYRHRRVRPYPFFSHTLHPDPPSDDSTWITPRTMLYTLTEGHLDCVQWLYETFADAEDIDLFKSITRQEWEDPGEVHVMDTAAKHGHLGVIKYLHEISGLFKETDQRKRKRGGTMSGTGPTCSSAAIDLAAGNNHLQVVEWLHHNRKEGFTEKAAHLAAINGHLEMVQWLQKHRAHEFKADTMDLAAQNGQLEVVKWLHDQNASCTTHAMDGAAGEGHLEVVKWLHEHRTEGCTTAAMDSAARGGHLAVVKWLHSNRSEGCTTAAMDAAAEKSFTDVVQWLHFNRTEGCTTAAMDAAATENNFDLVLFLYCYRREGPTRTAFVNTDDALTENIYEWLAEHYPDLEPPQNQT